MEGLSECVNLVLDFILLPLLLCWANKVDLTVALYRTVHVNEILLLNHFCEDFLDWFMEVSLVLLVHYHGLEASGADHDRELRLEKEILHNLDLSFIVVYRGSWANRTAILQRFLIIIHVELLCKFIHEGDLADVLLRLIRVTIRFDLFLRLNNASLDKTSLQAVIQSLPMS